MAPTFAETRRRPDLRTRTRPWSRPTADADAILRELAYVYHLTRSVKAEILEKKAAACNA